MGQCTVSRRERYAAHKYALECSKTLDKGLWTAAMSDREIFKVLVVGAAGSGKSTFLRQMQRVYGEDTALPKAEQVQAVYSTVLSMMKAVLEKVEVQNSILAQRFLAKGVDAEIDDELGSEITVLWNDPGLQAVRAKRGMGFRVPDSLIYFVSQMDRIQAPGYEPNQHDVLRTSVCLSSALVEVEKFVVDGVHFHLYDVGGPLELTKWKKWIHLFDNVTAVMFFVAISEYDESICSSNGDDVNCIDASVRLFEEIYSTQYFRQSTMLLILNKKDLFAEKLFRSPLRVANKRFDDFAGPYADDPNVDRDDAIAAGTSFITQLFKKKVDFNEEIYDRVMCATDIASVQQLSGVCRDILLRTNLKYSYKE